MIESKMGLMTRLRAEGRWDEADKFRDATRVRLKAEGMRRRDAAEEAWRLTAEKYAVAEKTDPQPAVESAPHAEPTNDGVLIEHTDDERRELAELVQDPSVWDDRWGDALIWAFAHRRVIVMPQQARSVLAWLLWKLCRTDFHRMSTMLLEDRFLRYGRRWRLPTSDELDQQRRKTLFELDYDETNAESDGLNRRREVLGRIAAEQGWYHSKSSKSNTNDRSMIFVKLQVVSLLVPATFDSMPSMQSR